MNIQGYVNKLPINISSAFRSVMLCNILYLYIIFSFIWFPSRIVSMSGLHGDGILNVFFFSSLSEIQNNVKLLTFLSGFN